MARRRNKRRQRLAKHPGRAGSPVVGFFASDGVQVCCEGPACVITGTAATLRDVLAHGSSPGSRTMEIRATTFAEIHWGLQRGAAYAFDEAAYAVFLPLAEQAGLRLGTEQFAPGERVGLHLIRIQLRAPGPPPAALGPTWLADDGLHALLPGTSLEPPALAEWSRRYQAQIRRSPLWDELVREFGPARAEQLLREFCVELRDS